jgi:hypothetical protein
MFCGCSRCVLLSLSSPHATGFIPVLAVLPLRNVKRRPAYVLGLYAIATSVPHTRLCGVVFNEAQGFVCVGWWLIRRRDTFVSRRFYKRLEQVMTFRCQVREGCRAAGEWTRLHARRFRSRTDCAARPIVSHFLHLYHLTSNSQPLMATVTVSWIFFAYNPSSGPC